MVRPLAMVDERPLGEAVESLLACAKRDAEHERRSDVRYPFSRPVTVLLDEHGCQLSAFAREISRGGIGLLHHQPLEPGETVIVLEGEDGTPLRLRTRIVWSRACGQGWHMSGGKFLALLD
jgi:hypothetical protein